MRMNGRLIDHDLYGTCIRIDNGTVEIVAGLDFGPRLLSFNFIGGRNAFYASEDFREARARGEWHIVGGHRLWHGPEKFPRTWLPDWKPVSYELKTDTLIIVQEEEARTQVVKEMRVSFTGDATVEVRHVIKNRNAWPVELSVWPLTGMAPGGSLIVKQPKRADRFSYDGFRDGRVVSLWPYASMADPRIVWGDRYIELKQDAGIREPFKFGLSNAEGWAAYLNDSTAFVKKYGHEFGGAYPDGGVSFEAYVDGKMLEMETLSPIARVQDGSEVTFAEEWRLFECDTVSTASAEGRYRLAEELALRGATLP
jgi:hypothetical protein